jgi:hypothetical protein
MSLVLPERGAAAEAVRKETERACPLGSAISATWRAKRVPTSDTSTL